MNPLLSKALKLACDLKPIFVPKVTQAITSVANLSTDRQKVIKMPEPKHLNQQSLVLNMFNEIDWIITDCDGVLWLERHLLEGTPEFFKKMRSLGKKIIFATNNNTKTRETLLSKLNKFGFEASLDEILVTSYSVALYLKNFPLHGKVYCLGTPVLRNEIEKIGLQCTPSCTEDEQSSIHDDKIDYENIKIDPDVKALVVGMDPRLNIVKMIKACTYAARVEQHLLIATNKDSTFPTANGIMVPGTGSYVDVIEKVSGRNMLSLGKPEKFFFECIRKIHPTLDPSRSMMIGDRLDTDILFGNNNNLKYTLLVGTGVNSLKDVKEAMKIGNLKMVPSHYSPKLSDLNQYFK